MSQLDFYQHLAHALCAFLLCHFVPSGCSMSIVHVYTNKCVSDCCSYMILPCLLVVVVVVVVVVQYTIDSTCSFFIHRNILVRIMLLRVEEYMHKLLTDDAIFVGRHFFFHALCMFHVANIGASQAYKLKKNHRCIGESEKERKKIKNEWL
ncbi:hypothetical protein RIF29_01988 [Crotalaria pallida]|uniref:Uncharacterized protein n=1 Tax=Crotalaria pallida TaxID=3830 RepID=A0AAN9P8D6_CROPI